MLVDKTRGVGGEGFNFLEMIALKLNAQSPLKQPGFSSRIYSVTLLGICSGLPFALSGSTLQAWFTESGLSLALLGFMSIIGWPYTFKWLWAPALDRLTILPLGRRKGWIFAMQMALILVLFAMSYLDPAQHPGFLIGFGILLAFFSATQDVGIDAYNTESLLPLERALGSGFNVTGYRLGMLFSGALALILADHLGWAFAYRCMGILLLGLSIFGLFIAEPKVLKTPSSMKDAFIGPLKDFWQRPNALWLISLIILYKLGEAYALSLTTPFLLRGLHFSLTDLAIANKVVGLIAAITGGIFGGWWMLRLGLYRALFLFGIFAALSNLLFILLAVVGKNYPLMLTVIFTETFFGSMSATAFVAFLMSLCNTQYTAMQYSALSSIASLGRVVLGSSSGLLVAHLGWINFYGISAAICIPGLYFIWKSQYLPCFENKPKILSGNEVF